MVLAHLLGYKIHLVVTTEAGVIARHIVARDYRRHAIGKVVQLERTVLGREQQPVARWIEHGVIGGTLDTLEQALLGDYLHLLCHRRQR